MIETKTQFVVRLTVLSVFSVYAHFTKNVDPMADQQLLTNCFWPFQNKLEDARLTLSISN